jgi:hypothetical protein
LHIIARRFAPPRNDEYNNKKHTHREETTHGV